MDLEQQTAQHYADWLSTLYRLDQQHNVTSDPVQAEAIIRWLNAHPELLEASWQCWRRRLTHQSAARARYWLDCYILGGILPAVSES